MGQVIPLTPLGVDIVLTNTDLVNAINLPNIPENAKMAQVYVNNPTNNVGIRYFENRDPSSTSGKILYPGGWNELYGSMRTVKITRDAAGATGLEVIISYFG